MDPILALRRLRAALRLPLLVLGAALCVRLFLVSPYVVEGSSMTPTLQPGQTLLGEQVSPRLGLQQGDIVIVRGPLPLVGEASIIKRVIAVGPATVEFGGGSVSVDGVVLDERYLPAGVETYGVDERYRVAAGEVFLLGDNRGGSLDSRVIGPVSISQVEARLLLAFPAP